MPKSLPCARQGCNESFISYLAAREHLENPRNSKCYMWFKKLQNAHAGDVDFEDLGVEDEDGEGLDDLDEGSSYIGDDDDMGSELSFIDKATFDSQYNSSEDHESTDSDSDASNSSWSGINLGKSSEQDPRRRLDERLRGLGSEFDNLDDDSINPNYLEPPSTSTSSSISDSHSHDGEDPSTNQTYVEYHPKAAYSYGQGKDVLSQTAASDIDIDKRKENPYYPFSCLMEWELVVWLSGLNASVAQLNEFFKLSYVSCIPSAAPVIYN